MMRATYGQFEITMIVITTVRPGWSVPPRHPSLPEHADARPRPSSRTGNASSTSMTRAMTVSVQPRKKPAIMPMVTPISTDRPVPTNATSSDTRAPSRTREKMSRPTSSTPIRCSELGPEGRPNASSASGEPWPGGGTSRTLRISGPKIATTISRTMNASATSATLSLRKRRQKSCRGERAATGDLPATISSTP